MNDYQHIPAGDTDVTFTGGAAAVGGNDPTIRDSTPRPRRFVVGDVLLERYRILSELGQGGMGVVYKCFDQTAGVEVALKALPPELSHDTAEMEEVRENFQLVSRLVHQNIAVSKNLERDPATGDCYLVMECAEGEDLKHWSRKHRAPGGGVPLQEALPILRQVAAALDYAHAERIMHRDIKPENIMVSTDGKVKILDFGLAAQIHTALSRVSQAYHGTSGTRAYMSPEQWRGSGQREPADQYALAVTAYELLAGHLPFESSDPDVMKRAVLEETPEPVEGLSKAAGAALLRGLAKVPEQRFPSCTDFVDALEGKKPADIGMHRRTRGAALWTAAALAFLILFGGFGAWQYHQTQLRAAEEARMEEKARREAEAEKARQEAEAEKARQEAEKARQEEARQPQATAPQEPATPPASAPAAPSSDDALRLEADTYDLQARLQMLKPQIDKAAYDRGQTFGEHLDALERNYNSAEGVMKDTGNPNRFTRAHQWYTQAMEACQWLTANAPLRQTASAALSEAQSAREKARGEGAETLGRVDFAKGDAALKDGQSAYDSGDFAAAQEKFRAASAAFGSAFDTALAANVGNLVEAGKIALQAKRWSEAVASADKALVKDAANAEAKKLKADAESGGRQERIAGHLTKARDAFGGKRWQEAVSAAGEALKLDAANAEAKKLKADAEAQLKPWLKVTATADGAVVPATFTCEPRFLSKGDNGVELSKGTDYTLTVTYEKDGVSWTAERAITASWGGVRQESIALQKVEFNGTVVLPGGVKLAMLPVKAGTFTMGSPESEDGRYSDETQHRVTLTKDYWLGKYEVTQEEWKAVMGTEPSGLKGARRPVEKVSWDDAQAFCEKLNRLYAGKLPRGYRFSLPTEAQWEYACRAGTSGSYSGGALDDVGWYSDNSGANTHEVGTKRANAWGFCDMHGNVWEWCQDWYDSYPGGAQSDPQGPATGSDRVYRGGCWLNNAGRCRAAYRGSHSPGYRFNDLGFRLALVPGS